MAFDSHRRPIKAKRLTRQKRIHLADEEPRCIHGGVRKSPGTRRTRDALAQNRFGQSDKHSLNDVAMSLRSEK